MPATIIADTKHRIRLWFVFNLFAAAVLCGCTVGPNYKRPDITVQTQWTHSASTQPSVADQTPPPAQWWTTLNDPTLNSLVHRACDGNLSVSIAMYRIAEARAQMDAMLPLHALLSLDPVIATCEGVVPLATLLRADDPWADLRLA